MSAVEYARPCAYDAMKTLARFAEEVEKQACPGITLHGHFCFEHNGEIVPPSDMVCYVWDKIDEMMQSINPPTEPPELWNKIVSAKRDRTIDDPNWCDTDRFLALRKAPIAKLVAMTDAAARLGQDVTEKTTFDAWQSLLTSNNPERRAEAQRLFDKEISLPTPEVVGASQTTAGQMLDETLSVAKKAKYADRSADESVPVGGEVKYRPAVVKPEDEESTKYSSTVVTQEDEEAEAPKYISLAA